MKKTINKEKDLEKIIFFLKGDIFHHFDDTYFIRYNSQKGLFAINKILKKKSVKNLESSAFYYHIYIDMLFEAVGQINDRFIEKDKYTDEMKKRVKRNREEYDFNIEKYPILYDKSIRNYIEHIISRRDVLIKERSYFGTFNFVHQDLDKELISNLLDKRHQQGNYLNMIDKTYNIIDVTGNKLVCKSVSLVDLYHELNNINKRSNCIWKTIN